MHCSKNADSSARERDDAVCRRRRAAAGLCVLGLAALLLPPLPAVAQSDAQITKMALERTDEGVFLTAQLRFELPPIALNALEKGIPMFFVAEAALLQGRWYWTDKRVLVNERYQRLSYLPLTRRWRLALASEPFGGNAGLGVSVMQHYESLPEALAAVERIGRWKIADASELDADAKYWVELSFRLDLSQLPRPFQIGAVGQDEWNIAASRSQRLGAPEPPR